jgi:DNA-binding transcriptional LysR family regulator
MTITQLEYFVAVAETLNFTRVAENYFISQTAVTLQIKALEEELGFSLFERNKRHVKLTSAGEVFLNEVKAVLFRLNEGKKKAKQISLGYSGSLKIGFLQGIEYLEISNIIQHYLDRYPNTSIHFHSDASTVLMSLLQEKKLDVVFSFKPSTKNNPDIIFEPYKCVPLYVVLHKNHYYSCKTTLTRNELMSETFLVIEAAKEEILFGFHISGFEPKNIVYVDSINSLIMMVTSNIGIAILPEYNVISLQNIDYINKIPLVNDKESFQIALAHHAQNENQCISDFIDIVNQYK